MILSIHRKAYFFAWLLCLPLTTFAQSETQTIDHSRIILSETSATDWENALVAGNGMIGVMEYGTLEQQQYVMNCHKFILPNGAPVPIPDISDLMEPMRKRMLAGEVGQAWLDVYAELKNRGLPGMIWTQSFHPGYILTVDLEDAGPTTALSRRVHCSPGHLTTDWTTDTGQWQRQTFSSRADDVIATRIKAPEGSKINATIGAQKAAKHKKQVTISIIAKDNMLNFRGQYHPQTLRKEVNGKIEKRSSQGGYEGVTRVIVDSGTVTAEGETLVVKNATEMILLTRLDRYKEDYAQWDRQRLQQSLASIETPFDTLLSRHSKIHQDMYDRVQLNLADKGDAEPISTERLIASEESDTTTWEPALLEKAFYNSRYLFIASSGHHYAPRLSGMFVGAWGAAWSGDYTMDSNANMAVMGGGIVDLPECMEGYFSVIERTQPQWREGAKKIYGCRGILGPIRIDGEVGVPHHVNEYHSHCLCTGLTAWILYPMYEHWQITGDQAFAQTRLHPLLKDLAQFYEDFLTYKDENGKYIFVPSNSPENCWFQVEPRTGASINSTIDIAACKHALTMLMEVEAGLGIEPHEGTERWQRILKKLPNYVLNRDGAFAEWAWPQAVPNYRHRHLSHMYPMWPAYEINPEHPDAATLIPAVRKAIDKKRKRMRQMHGNIQKMIGYIRIKEATSFERELKYFLENKYFYTSLATSHNLNHDIYNYDAILALQGLVAESIVFTHPGQIDLLPALPTKLTTGEIRGIKGRNRSTIKRLAWDIPNRRIELTIVSGINQNLTIIHRAGIKDIQTAAGIKSSALGNHARQIACQAGKPVKLTINW